MRAANLRRRHPVVTSAYSLMPLLAYANPMQSKKPPGIEVVVRLTASKPELTKAQRNDLYRSIEEGGLDPAQCRLEEDPYKPSTSVPSGRKRSRQIRTVPPFFPKEEVRIVRITHLQSRSIFSIEISGAERHGYKGTIADKERQRSLDGGWENLTESARHWAEDVKGEFVDPDLWAELRRRREFLTGDQHPDSANTPFTRSEQAEITEQLQKIKEYVKEAYSLSIEQREHTERRFDEAEDASRRVGRKDWLLMFGGALFSLILSAVVPPEVIQHILAMAAQGLGHLFGRQAPPGLPPH